MQLQKLNKRHQEHGLPQNETKASKEELSDFQKWQNAQDMERQMRLNKYNQNHSDNSGFSIPVNVSTTEIDCEPFSFKPKLHQSDAFQKLDRTRDTAGRKKKKPKPNRLEILRHRIATPDSMDDSLTSNGLMSNGDQNIASPENVRLDQTYSKQLGMSEQMKIYQNNLKVKESRQSEVMAGFQKPVLVRRDTRSTASSRTSTRNAFSPQVKPVSSGSGNKYQQNWKGQQQTQETSHGTDRLVIHDQRSSEPVSEYEEIQLVPCNICGRKFKVERLSQHKVVCSKTAGKKRKVFNMANARKKGTELEGFSAVRGSSKTVPTAPKSSWRSKHEDFINTIRHAKQISVYVAEGGKITDLPPPPPSLNPDYIQCQYCERRFAPKVAERHIPKCKETKSRPPPPKKRQPNRKR
uniref:Zinc finger C2HC domain-containing protein 1C-like n=1 Tax=Phallusia mammillata TaxID=59560 RepID=A0A6F9DXH7_9ASCI|nr:zinc finger C2HC domain-containing protein 1C-like [Phallusia mammillata]